jgi:hypothetical protein
MENRISLLGLARRGVVVAALFLGLAILALAGGIRTQSQQGEKRESPFYCNINALNAAERAHKKQISDKMAVSRVETNELPNGYAFRFQPGGVTLIELADWVDSERRCCLFFDIAIETEREAGPMWLKITGREGVKQFIRGEFKGMKVE